MYYIYLLLQLAMCVCLSTLRTRYIYIDCLSTLRTRYIYIDWYYRSVMLFFLNCKCTNETENSTKMIVSLYAKPFE